jgi:hypothetical protein
MQIGFDFTVGDEVSDFMLHKVVLKEKTMALSSKFFLYDTTR